MPRRVIDRAGGPVTRSAAALWPLPQVRHPPGIDMNITLSLAPLVSLIAGILILVKPRLLNYIVAGYLILLGIIGLLGTGA
jgi:hypothetical protein